MRVQLVTIQVTCYFKTNSSRSEKKKKNAFSSGIITQEALVHPTDLRIPKHKGQPYMAHNQGHIPLEKQWAHSRFDM